MTHKPTLRDHALLFAVAAIALLADQVSKRMVEATIPAYTLRPIVDFLDPYLTLTNIQNTGAAFSIFQNGGLFFIVVALIVSALIIYYAPRLPAEDHLSRVAMGLQLGGALGNLIDRLRQGFVTDFIYFQIPQIGFSWPVSNIADICIVGGVVLLILSSLRRDQPAEKTKPDSNAGDAHTPGEPAHE